MVSSQKIFLFALLVSAGLVQFRLLTKTNDDEDSGVSHGDAPRQMKNVTTSAHVLYRGGSNTFQTSSSSDLLEWHDGCLRRPSEPRNIPPSASTSPPRGLVVTMALAPKNRQHFLTARQQICSNLPNQWQWFLYPQGIDFLLVVQVELQQPNKRWTQKDFVKCLGLAKGNATGILRSWENLDGTTLEALEFAYTPPYIESLPEASSLSPIKIFIATTKVRYPPYIRQNPSLLGLRKLGPPGCSARLTYLQGCRWYTQEMLHLQILQGYDYFFKMDTDIIFHKFPTFHLLEDMRQKGAVFAHTAEYPKGDGSCAVGILDAIDNFTATLSTSTANTQQQSTLPLWKGSICSSKAPEMQRNADQYYCNFIIGKVDYFTSPWVLQFANFMSNYPDGFFRQKWGDQIFWHFAMGLFLESDGSLGDQYVVDYTDLRCKANPSCWFSSMDHQRYGANASELCNNKRGIFVHSKSLEYAQQHTFVGKQDGTNRKESASLPATNFSFPGLRHNVETQPLFESIYRWNCSY